MLLRNKTRNSEALALAGPFSVVVGGAAVLAGALIWGRPGMVAAAWGTALSLVNVWVLARLGARAARRAAAEGDPGAAAAGLQSALGAKSVILIVMIALFTLRGGSSLHPAPLALGLLVSVVALVLAGLLGDPAREISSGASAG
jgi:hypothetical protein